MEEIDNLEEYLSKLADCFDNLDETLEKTMILAKINELVFWLQMYQDKEKQV